jgi:ribonuclease BN (tRNA processing enzyme)
MVSRSAGASTLVLLGTGTPNAEARRSGPALALLVGEMPYLFDFGPGVVRQAAAARDAGIDALDPPNLRLAFLTHLHSDHTAGYPDLILTPWTLGREESLTAYGPRGLRAMTERILDAYREDIRERLEGPEPANETGHRVIAHEIEPGVVYEDGRVSIEAFDVNHGSWPAFGYRINAPDRVIVLSGDTAPFPGWEDAYAGCDVLIHEVRSAAGFNGLPAAWRVYHEAMHTSSIELARIASAVRPKRLVLYHALLHGVSEADLLTEVRNGYDGDVVLGRDLDVF